MSGIQHFITLRIQHLARRSIRPTTCLSSLSSKRSHRSYQRSENCRREFRPSRKKSRTKLLVKLATHTEATPKLRKAPCQAPERRSPKQLPRKGLFATPLNSISNSTPRYSSLCNLFLAALRSSRLAWSVRTAASTMVERTWCLSPGFVFVVNYVPVLVLYCVTRSQGNGGWMRQPTTEARGSTHMPSEPLEATHFFIMYAII